MFTLSSHRGIGTINKFFLVLFYQAVTQRVRYQRRRSLSKFLRSVAMTYYIVLVKMN